MLSVRNNQICDLNELQYLRPLSQLVTLYGNDNEVCRNPNVDKALAQVLPDGVENVQKKLDDNTASYLRQIMPAVKKEESVFD